MSEQSASSVQEPREPREPRCIVVGVDGTPADSATLRTVILEAHHRLAPVHLVRSFPPSKGSAGSPAAVAARKAEQGAAARHLQRLRTETAAALPGLPVTTTLTSGPLARALVEASRTADMVVLRGARTGVIAQEVARHAWCPVLLDRARVSSSAHDGLGLRGIPGVVADDTGGVVVGVGDAASATDLLSTAVDEAARRGTGLLVVHARPVRAVPRPRQPAADTAARSAAQQDEAAEQLLADAVDRLRIGRPGVPVVFRRVEGAAGSALVALSSGADLLVVGRPHRTGLLPRTTTIAVDRATSPVLVVPVSSRESGSPSHVVIGQESRPAHRPTLPASAPGTSV
jgi:nucleotide-binding universal stress UspA family protein